MALRREQTISCSDVEGEQSSSSLNTNRCLFFLLPVGISFTCTVMLPSQMRGNEEKGEGGEGRGARKGGREAKMAAGSREFI